jgi:hypothetical protein
MKPSSLVRPLLLCAALLLCAFSLPRRAAAQVTDTTAAARDTLYEVRLSDGSVLYGRVEERGDEVVVRTQAGAEVRVPRGQIARMTPVGGRVVAGRVWPRDPNATRLFFGPTARAVGAGKGYLGVYEVVFPFVTLGVSENFSVSGGTPLIPEAIGEVWYFAPKLTVLETERVAAAAGALVGAADGEMAGILYGVGTLGDTDRALSVGAGWGFSDGDLHNQPVVMLGGELRVGPSTKLISENYIFPGEDFGALSGGVRFFGERLSADIGIAASLEDDGWFPLVNFVYSF